MFNLNEVMQTNIDSIGTKQEATKSDVGFVYFKNCCSQVVILSIK